MPGRVVGAPECESFESSVAAVVSTLRMHGLVVSEPLDVQAELRERVGAYLVPYVVFCVFNPAITHRVLRCDPTAGARTVVLLVIRSAPHGIVVEVPDLSRPCDPATCEDVRQLRQRMLTALQLVSPGVLYAVVPPGDDVTSAALMIAAIRMTLRLSRYGRRLAAHRSPPTVCMVVRVIAVPVPLMMAPAAGAHLLEVSV